MRLWLTPPQAEAIAKHALAEQPRECCGLIAGTGEQAKEIIPVPNSAADQEHHFYLEAAAFTKAMFDIEKAGLSLIGIYHSHPKGEAIPSQVDIQQAAYPKTAYVIVGLKHSKPEIAAWDIQIAEVNRIDLHIGFERPEPAELPLSRAQKVAILLASAIAFILLIVISLSLLPPAPIIPATP